MNHRGTEDTEKRPKRERRIDPLFITERYGNLVFHKRSRPLRPIEILERAYNGRWKGE